MDKQLSTEQLMLLENLMYVGGDNSITATKAETVGDWLSTLNGDNVGASDMMDNGEWNDILGAVKSDDTLMSLRIGSVHVDSGDGGGDGVSAVFVNPDSKEAVFAFKGTETNEWKDDFVGGASTDQADGVSTAQQENALKWFRLKKDEGDYSSVTVLGHSKGGNKAKYITVMDDSVDRCVSMDGQGFSDQFINKYHDQIAKNQDKIENNNSRDDYVNILLNDIGKKKYYQPQNISSVGFFENHCPNAYFKFSGDGTYTTEEQPQSGELKEMDQFLNSYLRSLPDKDRQGALQLFGTIAEEAAAGRASSIPNVLLNGNNPEMTAYLLAFVLKYEETNPEFGRAVESLLHRYGIDEKTLDFIEAFKILADKGFADELFGTVDFAAGTIISPFDYEALALWLKAKYNIELSGFELRRLVSILGEVDIMTESINATKNGADISVKSVKKDNYSAGTGGSGSACRISIKPETMPKIVPLLQKVSSELSEASSGLTALKINFYTKDAYSGRIMTKIGVLAANVSDECRKAKLLADSLERISHTYADSEAEIKSLITVFRDS